MASSEERQKASSTAKVSIIVPCYNVERHLRKCMDSLLAQTLQDIEIIGVNDGSPDACSQILHEYERDNPGKVKVVDRENGGLFEARKSGIAIAHGEYIGFLDSDDWAAPEFCEKLYNTAIETGADVTVCGFQRIDEKTGKVTSTEMVKARNLFDLRESPVRALEVNPAVWNKLFKANILKELPDVPTTPHTMEDLVTKLLWMLDARTIAFVPESLVYYLVREGSLLKTLDKQHIDDTYNEMLEVRDIYEARGVPEEQMELLDMEAFVHMGISLMLRIVHDPDADFARIVSENEDFLDANFPRWRKSSMGGLEPVWHYGGSYPKIWASRQLYKAGLLKPALSLYKTMVERLNFDIKW